MSEISPQNVAKIKKRDGRIVEFNITKIAGAIFKAAQSVGGKDYDQAVQIAQQVKKELLEIEKETPSVEQVQDLVEKALIEGGHAKTAKAFILFRYKKNEERKRKAMILGKAAEGDENLDFSTQALSILERRYLLKDENGTTIETPKQMIERVANHIAQADGEYGASKEEVAQTASRFFSLMAQRKFLPTTPTLMNAGTKNNLLNATYVLPVEDTMESIFGSLRDAAVIHQKGGGTGFSFSRLRPKGDRVKKHVGVASGPVSFMKVYDQALDVIKQGGVRPGANMAVLRVDHPDVIRFIECKRDKRSMNNFNISVGVTDNFMRAVEEDREYYVISPRTERRVGKLRARDVFAMITQNAWKTGDPGLLFLDEINRKHPAKHLGEIETTNQCAEAPLLSNESCALGALNLMRFLQPSLTDLDWDALEDAVKTAIHFLDNVVDMNVYPSKKIKEQTLSTRKLGLGLMGFADLLCALKIKYDSQEGLEMADRLLYFIKKTAYDTSTALAQKRGVCPAWEGSDHQKAGRKMRNMTCLSLSPTGSRSILADCSPGCEPLFAISYQSTVLSNNSLVHTNKIFENIAKERDFYTPELVRKISRFGSVQHIKDVPKDVRDVFVTAQDISPEWHIAMQATLQKHVDNAISKTINFPRTAAIKEVELAYVTAWKQKCKGITIYRDGSYEDQVITIGD